MKKRTGSLTAAALTLALTTAVLSGCSSAPEKETTTVAAVAESTTGKETSATEGTKEQVSAGNYYSADAKAKDIVEDAAKKGKVGNWGLGNEYEVQALLSKYSQNTAFLSQAFDMDGFDDDSILLASAMTYNELGLIKNTYQGGYGYGDTVNYIDMNDEGVAMLEDNIFTTKEFAKANPNTVKAFISASMKGWEYACANPKEAAEIVFNAGSSVSSEHQAYMAEEVKKLVETDTKGNKVTELGKLDDEALQQTLDLAKKYIKLNDSTAAEKLQTLTLDDFRDATYWNDAKDGSNLGKPEKADVSIQLKWLPQAQFMGYYVAAAKGYYKDAGLNVTITPGGGDIGETTAVNSGQVDFGVTWDANLIAANAGGMNLIAVSQVYQRSGLVLVYKRSK
jgi:NitT/TauT family transport system substrate-binding protein